MRSAKNRKVILLEFNELCPPLLTKWMSEGKLPNFRRFFESSRVFTAVADVTDEVALAPWIQWYSLHTGLSYDQHKVFHLTDGPKAPHQDIWRFLTNAGLKVGSFASMNARGFGAPAAFFLPDPWCTSEQPYPQTLSAYQKVVLNVVQDSSKSELPNLQLRDYVRFAFFMLRNGLKPRTVWAIARQMFSELRHGETTRWRRAPLLDKLQADLFLKFWDRESPEFSTFFINSTAHYQHAYWHFAFPEQFTDSLMAEVNGRDQAILFGYQQMDSLLPRFFELEREGAMLVLCTALSQQRAPKYETYFHRYRLHNAGTFLADCGVQFVKIEPVMAEQYMITFADDAATQAARKILGALKFGNNDLFRFDKSAENSLFVSCDLTFKVADDGVIEWSNGDRLRQTFGELFYDIGHTKSGDHHPDSVLWFKTGDHRVHEPKVSILDVVPTLFDLFGVSKSNVGAGQELRGSSLAHLLPIR